MIKIINLKKNNKYYLVGDIGGTNSRLAVYNNFGESIFSKTYDNNLKRYSIKGGFYLICQEFFISWSEFTVTDNFYLENCCFAIAGSIYNRGVSICNRKNWGKIREKIIAHIFNIPVKFINDFIGSSYGALLLDLDKDVEFINGSYDMIRDTHPKCLIGAGTGLGQSYLTWNSSEYIAYPSEGGHSNFSPQNKLQHELCEWLINKYYDSDDNYPRISKERVISGRGILDIYNFLKDSYYSEDNDIHNNNNIEKVNSKIISQQSKTYFSGEQNIFTQTMKIFTNAYGSETGNMSLQYLPYGGLYIVGGIAVQNLEWIQSKEFIEPLFNKGRLTELLKDIPIILINNQNAINNLGKNGAWYYAKNKM